MNNNALQSVDMKEYRLMSISLSYMYIVNERIPEVLIYWEYLIKF